MTHPSQLSAGLHFKQKLPTFPTGRLIYVNLKRLFVTIAILANGELSSVATKSDHNAFVLFGIFYIRRRMQNICDRTIKGLILTWYINRLIIAAGFKRP